ncbi:MAG: GYF domain-containing protein [Oligoflexia bacterium]|nr:GYF domain-containing protein [Oligoflexia bacterium]
MENTGKLSAPKPESKPDFKNDRAEWFLAEGDQWIGPLTAHDVYKKVLDREITLAHFVWRAGQEGWERICDVKTFQVAVPKLPSRDIQREVKQVVKEAAKPAVKPAAVRAGKAPPPFSQERAGGEEADEARIWFLYYNDSQFGPFSAGEVNRYLAIGKINERVFAWRDGMSGWERIEKIKEFRLPPVISQAESLGGGRIRIEREGTRRTENRKAPRRPLVAKILATNERALVAGVCRDISVGGLQVLTDRVPGPVGGRIKLNVSSVGEGGNAIDPFVAEGVIVRILEDGRGFSFRFERLGDGARKAIEKYIGSVD